MTAHSGSQVSVIKLNCNIKITPIKFKAFTPESWYWLQGLKQRFLWFIMVMKCEHLWWWFSKICLHPSLTYDMWNMFLQMSWKKHHITVRRGLLFTATLCSPIRHFWRWHMLKQLRPWFNTTNSLQLWLPIRSFLYECLRDTRSFNSRYDCRSK